MLSGQLRQPPALFESRLPTPDSGSEHAGATPAKSAGRIGIAVRAAAAGVGLMLLGGCAGMGYYWQSVSGHMQMINSARPVPDWMADPATPEALRQRLALSQRIRSFAVTELELPDNASYRSYADLHRNAVVWNVVAAPEFSLTPKTSCFPVAGCVHYQGYFSEADARREAEKLKTQGLEVSIYGVPAYSTLGWMNWAGGDPLLSTFIRYPEGELARIIFHELAHQVTYASGDTTFNESFASTVERLGSQRWLLQHAGEAARRDYAALDQRRHDFRALTLATRRQLADIYKEKEAVAQENRADTATKSIAKAKVMQNFRDNYAALKMSWGGFAGYDPWVAGANNASFAVQAAYDEMVPAFEALFERQGGNWRRFYDSVKQLARLPKEERLKALETHSADLKGSPPHG
jgi:predicted aminopeptidase